MKMRIELYDNKGALEEVREIQSPKWRDLSLFLQRLARAWRKRGA